MLLVLVVTSLLGTSYSNNVLNQELGISEDYSAEDRVVACVMSLLKRHFATIGQVTVVEIRYSNERLLQAVHSQSLLNVVNRKPISKHYLYNQAYLVTAGNVSDFTQNFPYLVREPTWNPHVKFLIIVKWIKEAELRQVFDVLLHLHVINVLVVNRADRSLYTYNPYENYGCGKYYNRVVNFGRCPTSVNVYPNKLKTGLRRCKLTVTVPHWPPYTVHHTKKKHGMHPLGVEQFIINSIRKKEGFKISYIYKNESEEYSNVSNDMQATGPLSLLQKNKTDIMMGGMVLSAKRAAAFDYTCAHLSMAEDLKVVVRIASFKPAWTSFYLAFDMLMWLLLLLCLITFAMLMMLLLETRDIGDVYLKLLDGLLLHGCHISSKWTVKCVFIFWVWFAYLVNCFYQSSLMSLTTKPVKEIEYTRVAHISQYELKLCLSPLMIKLLKIERNYKKIPYKLQKDGCDDFFGSIKTVGETENQYTVVLYSIFMYHKYDYYDKYGNPRVRGLKSTLSKLSYAIYMYKGFPMSHRLHMLALRLRESGFIQKFMDYQLHMMSTKHRYKQKDFEARLVAPWYLYIFGLLSSTIVFFAEHLNRKKSTQKRRLNARRV
ncbi:uncharacterized protein LOC115440591 [Manduca sexta]|uniref:uncharacterized protein LOC115440591 n=1 Tax=Manduca sexta TaxID=7130 RepID=UPI001183E4DD|nr:uncharacterized protein LOC115440591 [Manduca sexta]